LRYTRPKTDKQESRILLQNNKLIHKGKFSYPKAIGGKTGYLTICGHNIVAAAKQGDRTLIAVLMGYKDINSRYADTIKLFEAGFNQTKVQRVILKKGPRKEVLKLRGASGSIKTHLADDVKIEYYPAEEPKLKCTLYWTATEPSIKKDQKVGELRVQTSEGKMLQVVPLLAQEDMKATWLWRLRHWF
jgi:D-alanyl-D-alanine carboxypeptidase (penicillin-binding protein 5/6)